MKIKDESKVEFETVVCEICGSENYNLHLTASDSRINSTKMFSLVKCADCGLVFLNPRPTKESMNQYYLETDPEKAPGKPSLYERFYFRLFRKIPSLNKGVILDVGCGSGRYIYTLKEQGWTVKGIDYAFTDYGRNVLNLDIYEGDLTEKIFQSNSFDVVTMWWSLEHIYNPTETIKEAFRILKKGGVLVVGVQNIDSLEARLFNQDWFHLFLPKHVSHFSPETLKIILNKSGFNKITIRHDMFSFGFIGSIQLFLNKKGLKVSFNNPLFYLLSLPIDIILGLFKNSGLITAYAYKT